MTDTTNAVIVTAVEPQALKSTDTSTKVEANIAPVIEPIKVKPVEAQPEVTPPEGDSTTHAPDADSSTHGRKRPPRWMMERMERERQAAIAETREAMLREFTQTKPQAEPVVTTEPAAKTLQDFDFDQGKYTDYLVDLKLTEREKKQRVAAEQSKQAEAQESFKAKVDAFEEKAGDGAWQDIVESPLNTDAAFKPLTELFLNDEHDLDIAHYLATNLDEAKRILALPKLQQLREVAKLADRFEGVQEDPKPVAVSKKTTSAPPPVKTISGAGKPSVDIFDQNVSTADRIAQWKKQGGRR